MNDPVTASDELDERILQAPIPKRSYLVEGLFIVVIVLMSVGFTVMFLQLDSVTQDTRKVVQLQIPQMQERIDDKDKRIRELRDSVDKEVEIILRLSQQVIELGGDPVPTVEGPTPTTEAPRR